MRPPPALADTRRRPKQAWLTEYNTYRPHSSLGGLTPAEYAKKWATNQPSRP